MFAHTRSKPRYNNEARMFGALVKFVPDLREFQWTADGTKQWRCGGIGLSKENLNHSISQHNSGEKLDNDTQRNELWGNCGGCH